MAWGEHPIAVMCFSTYLTSNSFAGSKPDQMLDFRNFANGLVRWLSGWELPSSQARTDAAQFPFSAQAAKV
jgi:hypothetical protein